MKLEQSFEVKAPVETVWEALIDVQRVAPCLPGAEITQANDDGSYEGNFQVKLGPTTAAYQGKLSMESLDEAARRATMKATGRDKRGQGSANATIVSTMHEQDGGTRVEVEADFTITGRLARFGRGGMMQDISNRMLRDFASCLRDSLEGEQSGEPEADAVEAPPGEKPSTETTPPAAARTGETASSEGAGGAAASSAARATSAAPQARPRPAPQPAKPVRGFSLFISVLLERIKRLLSRKR